MLRRAAILLGVLALTACGAPAVDADGGAGGGEGGGAGGGAGGGSGGGGGGSGGSGGGGAATGPSRYPFGLAQSPMTAAVAAKLKSIELKGPLLNADVFAKVGDSNTVNTNFVSCFAGANVDLAGRTALQNTVDFFKGGTAGSTTPWDRVSLAATVGWRAANAIAGAPSPLDQEWTAVKPRYATVMFGTNDIQFNDVTGFGADLFTIVDTLTAKGTIPILTSIPPRDDNAAADLQVPRYNAVALGVAQARQIPFVDLHQALVPIPLHGIGPDGLHLNVYTPTGARGCVLTAAGLDFGHNNRNLLTLQALDRARAAVAGVPAPDSAPAALVGLGTLASPFVIPSLPFIDNRDTRVGAVNRISTWSGCSAVNEGGPEFLYKLTVGQATNVRAIVVSIGGADIDVHIVDSTGAAAGCIARNDKVVTATLAPGTWYLALDTFVTAATPQSGEYLLAVLAD